MKWFRFYAEVLHDPKVQKLPPQLFKDWVNILCLAAQNEGAIPANRDNIAFSMRLSRDRVDRIIKDLERHGLVEVSLSHITPHNWEERQFKSDSSAERMRRLREKRKSSHAVTGDGDVTSRVTPPEQNRTEQNRTEHNSSPISISEQHEEAIRRTACEMRQKHRKTDGLGGFALEDLLIEITKSAVDPAAALLDIQRKHAARCESDWRDTPVRFWPKLLNWLRDGGYLDPLSSEPSADEQYSNQEVEDHWQEMQRLMRAGVKTHEADQQARQMIAERRRHAAAS